MHGISCCILSRIKNEDVNTIHINIQFWAWRISAFFLQHAKLAERIRTCFLCKENEIPYCVTGTPGNQLQRLKIPGHGSKTTKAPKKQLCSTVQSVASDPFSYMFLININGTSKRNLSKNQYQNSFLFVCLSSAICLDS